MGCKIFSYRLLDIFGKMIRKYFIHMRAFICEKKMERNSLFKKQGI